MEELFVTYKESLDLKKLEFDEPCLAGYQNASYGEAILVLPFMRSSKCNTDLERANSFTNSWIELYKADYHCTTPLWQQAFDFFNEKFKLASHVDIFAQTHLGDNYYYQIVNFADVISPETTVQVYGFKTSYDAKLACLKKLITYLQ